MISIHKKCECFCSTGLILSSVSGSEEWLDETPDLVQLGAHSHPLNLQGISFSYSLSKRRTIDEWAWARIIKCPIALVTYFVSFPKCLHLLYSLIHSIRRPINRVFSLEQLRWFIRQEKYQITRKLIIIAKGNVQHLFNISPNAWAFTWWVSINKMWIVGHNCQKHLFWRA